MSSLVYIFVISSTTICGCSICFVHMQHDAPVKTVHWIKGTTYSCLMTGSWDKTLKVHVVSTAIAYFL